MLCPFCFPKEEHGLCGCKQDGGSVGHRLVAGTVGLVLEDVNRVASMVSLRTQMQWPGRGLQDADGVAWTVGLRDVHAVAWSLDSGLCRRGRVL